MNRFQLTDSDPAATLLDLDAPEFSITAPMVPEGEWLSFTGPNEPGTAVLMTRRPKPATSIRRLRGLRSRWPRRF